MPKAERTRTKAHLASAKSKPPGDTPASPSPGVEEKAQPQLTAQPVTKKEKMFERRESFLQKLGTGLPALSKNHARRMKRKAKEQLAGHTLSDLSHVLDSMDGDNDSAANAQEPGHTKLETKKPKQQIGLIGEGSSRPLSKSQRKRMFELERFRHPRILQNPEFSSNPFQTIQTHAKNTLLKHTPGPLNP